MPDRGSSEAVSYASCSGLTARGAENPHGEVLDVESLRRHYARTCDAWSDKLEANRSTAETLVGERHYRIWQIYLAGCAYGFANSWMNLYQVLCSKAGNIALSQQPLTRDYMYAPVA